MTDVETVYLLDDEPDMLNAISRLLKAHGFAVQPFENVQDRVESGVRLDRYNDVVVQLNATLEEEAAVGRTEYMFRHFLTSKDRTERDVDIPFFDWLKGRIPSEEDLKYSKKPFRVTLSNHFRVAPEDLEKGIRKAKKESDREYLDVMFLEKLLEGPPTPTCEEVRKHWSRESHREA